ncbi:MAG: thioredoxin domain-containing protein [Spirochaetaceae bacterium]|nr:thioredoxin domain-containing protein [Spirochaetaceae bacterium]
MLLVVAGLVLTVVLTNNYFQHVVAGQVSGCSISNYVDCDRVSESRFAAVAGVPISAVALAVYGAMGVLLALPLLRPFRRLAAVNLDVATALSGLSTVVALALLVIAAVVIRALCLYCAALQLVTFALFAVLLWRRGRAGAAAGGGRQARGPGTAFGSAALALAAGGVVAAGATLALETSAIGLAGRSASSSAGGLGATSLYLSRTTQRFTLAQSPGVGPADAPVQVVVFGDYNCSHCRSFDPEALKLAEDFPDDVRVVFKFFPLDATCNPYMGREQVSSSCVAAAAAYAAHKQDRFLDFHLLLYEHFQNHAPARVLANAEEAGIDDVEAFLTDLQSEDTARHIRRDIDEAVQAGVQGTPTVFVNGRRLETNRLPPGTTRYSALVRDIRALLRAAL